MTRIFPHHPFLCSEPLYVWCTSGEHVKYKSIVVLTFTVFSGSHLVWCPAFTRSALSPARRSSLFIVLGMFTCEVAHTESRIDVMCFTNNLLQINHCNHIVLVFIIHCINLAQGRNCAMSGIIECGCRQFLGSSSVQEQGWVPALFFHLNSHQLHQWNCLVQEEEQ